MKVPEIRIYLAYLLLSDESRLLAGKNKLSDYKDYQRWTKAYQEAWAEKEYKILKALQDILGVNFYKTVIDVACADYFRTKSEPLIVNFRNEPDQFVDVLTHELCHELLTDNNKIQILNQNSKQNLTAIWEKLFGSDHEFIGLIHIPVHALCKYIYQDVLKEPSRLDRDMDSVKKYNKGYSEAWDYVNKNDYKQILADLKKSYQEMPA